MWDPATKEFSALLRHLELLVLTEAVQLQLKIGAGLLAIRDELCTEYRAFRQLLERLGKIVN